MKNDFNAKCNKIGKKMIKIGCVGMAVVFLLPIFIGLIVIAFSAFSSIF